MASVADPSTSSGVTAFNLDKNYTYDMLGEMSEPLDVEAAQGEDERRFLYLEWVGR